MPGDLSAITALLIELTQRIEHQNQLLAQLQQQLSLLEQGNAPTVGESRLVVGPVCLDVAAHRAFVEQKELSLHPAGFALLQLFLRYPGKLFSRLELLPLSPRRVMAARKEHTVDAHIRELRLALGEYGRMIQTVRGVGYRLVPPPERPF
ncbi:MAG: response regulator transcription factor [Magnetococcales bacterium]|nr:response regulator transcription factor [Magnetococcales bacterium]